MFKIYVNSAEGEKVRVNLPMALVKVGLEMGLKMPQVSGNKVIIPPIIYSSIYQKPHSKHYNKWANKTLSVFGNFFVIKRHNLLKDLRQLNISPSIS